MEKLAQKTGCSGAADAAKGIENLIRGSDADMKRHVVLLVNVLAEADRLRKGGAAGMREIADGAAEWGVRVSLIEKEERYEGIYGKIESAAELLLSNAPLAAAACREFMDRRIARKKSGGKRELREEYEKAVCELDKQAFQFVLVESKRNEKK
jgi:hypothetical protein